MSKFVLAGKTDCPHYAKAELLADALQRSLPNFRTHKIPIPPNQWMEWLEDTCKRNGWKHEKSPLVWRELVDQGGKGVLLGGFSDFLEHCQDYYSITSDMSTDIMLSVAAENLETSMDLIVEEQHRVSLIKPLHIWITSALCPTCHLLMPSLLSAEVFPHIAAISLHLLDLEGDEEGLQGLRMEMEDLALPLLHQVTIHTDLKQAFQEADVIILLDDWWRDGSDSERRNRNEAEKKKVKDISERYREYGQLIDARANKEVKVIVSGDAFVNLKCSILVDNARSIDFHHFVTMATQLENEARAIIAKKLKVRASDIADVIVWGNVSGVFHIDLQRAKVFNYDGAIKGPSFFSQSLFKIFHDRKWMETDFQDLVRCRRAAVTSKTRRVAAMSAANGILTILKAWNDICNPDEVFSLGVLCSGYYDLPDGSVLSVPVTLTGGKWSVFFDVTVGDKLKETLHFSAAELRGVWQVTTEDVAQYTLLQPQDVGALKNVSNSCFSFLAKRAWIRKLHVMIKEDN
ncbi:putative malate dehydrogenase 1B isoform X2 [Mastacembelus armatus]|uniref:putative malate dehydrogenase 1B isoform X2 n=1 Tax=Mastacembelus armatus TaxID=205130 RepID=UPI000E45F06B|nr:putative malate dehydrogenase 1B isoform X2 [Mastacembelus armatus]